jgi:hypothetical protein
LNNRTEKCKIIRTLVEGHFNGNILEIYVGRKQEKAAQRRGYQEAFKNIKHGHGTRSIRKKEEAALGK